MAKITRRALGGVIAAAASAVAQKSEQSGQDLKSAEADLREQAQQLAAVKLPIDTEPAFSFKA